MPYASECHSGFDKSYRFHKYIAWRCYIVKYGKSDKAVVIIIIIINIDRYKLQRVLISVLHKR